MGKYVTRLYRRAFSQRFRGFYASYKETDLWIGVDPDSYDPRMEDFAASRARSYRLEIEAYASRMPNFLTSLVPIAEDKDAPPIVAAMIYAGRAAGVGPMAAVAGAVAEFVGRDLDAEFACREIAVENGGDLWLKYATPIDASVFAGESPLSGKVGVSIPPEYSPLGLCTSSGTVGPSLSLGRADAAMVACRRRASTDTVAAPRPQNKPRVFPAPTCPEGTAALADAWATALGNAVSTEADIEAALDLALGIEGLVSAILIKGGRMGIRGELPLKLFAGYPDPTA